MTYAEIIHKKYSSKLGSEVIATKKALRILEKDFSSRKNIANIIELGSGIGTLTEFLFISSPDSAFQLMESNDWCLKQLEESLFPLYLKVNYKVYNNFDSLVKDCYKRKASIIIDDFIGQKETDALFSTVIPEYVFIEGHRRSQRVYVAKGLHELGYQFRVKIYVNSADSMKGATTFTIYEDKNLTRVLITKFQIVRLILLKTRVVAHLGQSVGVRYRTFLQILSGRV